MPPLRHVCHAAAAPSLRHATLPFAPFFIDCYCCHFRHAIRACRYAISALLPRWFLPSDAVDAY
jgi:hypothetical protein